MMPESSCASTFAPYTESDAASYVDGSMDGHGGVQSGFTPDCLSTISAMWPPPSSTVTRRSWFSMVEARRPRYSSEDGIAAYYARSRVTHAPSRAA